MKAEFDAALSPAWAGWWASFLRHMRALNRSRFTIATYTESAESLARFCRDRGLPLDPLMLSRPNLEEYIGAELERNSESTARTRFIALRAFYTWLADEGEIERSPMDRMKVPKVADQPTGVLDDDQVADLLRACSGRDFLSRRDAALIRLMYDSGTRRSEVAGMLVEDVHLNEQTILVTSKGGDQEYVYFGARTARDLDRYLRVRPHHPKAALPQLWLAPKGALTGSGLYQMLQERAAQAGLDVHVRPHLFRHSFAHSLKAAGASDEDTARLGRWKDVKVMGRYGRGLAARRAQETHRRLSPGDRV
jgi:site-specific recombinase XerD